jgi:hypothetical protein
MLLEKNNPLKILYNMVFIILKNRHIKDIKYFLGVLLWM